MASEARFGENDSFEGGFFEFVAEDGTAYELEGRTLRSRATG